MVSAIDGHLCSSAVQTPADSRNCFTSYRRVGGPHPESVAGLVGETAAFQAQHHVAHVLAGAAAGDGRFSSTAAGNGSLRRCRSERCGRPGTRCGEPARAGSRRTASRSCANPVAAPRLLPGRAGGLEVDVALHPVLDAPGAQRFQPGIQLAPGLAEILVAAVAEREHGVLELVEARRPIAEQEFEERFGAVRRLAEAVGGHDEQHAALLLELGRAELGQVHGFRLEAEGPYGAGQLVGDAAAVAGLGRVAHRPRRQRRSLRGLVGLRLQRCSRPGRASRQTGEITAGPPQLLLIEPARQTVQLAEQALVRCRRGFLQDGYGHGVWPSRFMQEGNGSQRTRAREGSIRYKEITTGVGRGVGRTRYSWGTS
jgi:hypothetical protein